MKTVLIKNGLIVGGDGSPPEKNDIFIRHGRIAEIGNFKKLGADLVIDAVNAFIVPGFIDVHSEADHFLEVFDPARQKETVRRGITTVIGGQAGWSLAPIISEFSLDWLAPGRRRPATGGVNFHWQSVADFLKKLESRHLIFNFGTLAGYSNIRRAFGKFLSRDLTERSLAAAMEAVNGSFKDGALGCSLNFSDIQNGKMPKLEIEFLLETVAASRGLLALRLPDRPDAVRLASFLESAKEKKINIQFGRFQPLADSAKDWRKVLDLLEESGLSREINFDCVLDGRAAVESRFFLPAPLDKADWPAILRAFEDREAQEKIEKNFRNFDKNKICVRRAPAPLDFLAGRSLAEFAAKHDLAAGPAFIKLLKMAEGEISFFYDNVSAGALDEAALSPRCFIAAAGRPESFANFFRLAESAKWPIEKIAAKLSGQPARKFRLAGRGLLKKDFWADIVVLRDQKPSAVLVNGRLVFDERGGAGFSPADQPAGRVIRKT